MKHELLGLLEQGQFERIAELAAQKNGALGTLVSLTYHADARIAWRAVEAMGVAADRIARDNPEYVRNHLRRLYWLISEESGGQCWRAPEAMAEIVRRRPEQFGDYAPIVVTLIESMADEDLGRFRPGILWAIGRLAAIAVDPIEQVLPKVVAALEDLDPQTRGMAVWCLTQLGRGALLAKRRELLADEGPVEVYEDGTLSHTTVGALFRRCAGLP